MKIAGIIAEYNPFHNGHAWHVRQTRSLTGCDYVIACMAGHFTQRGEAACMSKWARTRMALECGIDAVFELPAMFAVRSADVFARGGVAILGGLGADILSFGSETEDLGLIHKIALLKSEEPEAVSRRLREKLGEGMSHARAWGEAAAEYCGLPVETLNQPNLILASEYVRMIDALRLDMQPVAVLRKGAYHGEDMGPFPSAAAIRSAFARGDVDAAVSAIPEPARSYAAADAMHPMDDILMYRLRGMSLDQLRALPESGEGIENRLYRQCRQTGSREALLDGLKCKRYTRTRLSRMLTYAVLSLDKALAEACPLPPYARLLGARETAKPLLGELKARACIPIFSNTADLRGDACFELECRATDLWSLMHDAPEERRAGREFREKFVRVQPCTTA